MECHFNSLTVSSVKKHGQSLLPRRDIIADNRVIDITVPENNDGRTVS